MPDFPFSGFAEPQANFYCMPNNWFSIINGIRRQTGPRAVSIIKVLEYLIKQDWFVVTRGLGLTEGEIRNGRRQGSYRADLGTRLNEDSIERALGILIDLGFVEIANEKIAKPRRYRLRIQRDEIGMLTTDISKFNGFPKPTTNYFKIPNVWTDITAGIDKAVIILLTEYLIRHGYGYHNSNGLFMDVDEIAHGRRYRDGNRYDTGVQFDKSNIFKSLEEAIQLRLIVWTDRSPDGGIRRLYSARMEGMEVNDTGEYMGRLPWETVEQYEFWKNQSANERVGISTSGVVTDASSVVTATSGVVTGTSGVVTGTSGADMGTSGTDAGARGAVTGKLGLLIHTQNTPPKHLEKTAITTDVLNKSLAEVVVAADPLNFLNDLGVIGSSCQLILRQKISPEMLLGWGLYIKTQEKFERSPGFLVNMCKENAPPPQTMLRFAGLSISDWLELIDAREEWEIYKRASASPHLDDVIDEWMKIYAHDVWQMVPQIVKSRLVEIQSLFPESEDIQDPPEVVEEISSLNVPDHNPVQSDVEDDLMVGKSSNPLDFCMQNDKSVELDDGTERWHQLYDLVFSRDPLANHYGVLDYPAVIENGLLVVFTPEQHIADWLTAKFRALINSKFPGEQDMLLSVSFKRISIPTGNRRSQ